MLALLFVPPAAAVATIGAYLLFLSAVGLVARRSAPPAGPRVRRFAILVPAHDEAGVIERLLRSLAAQRYPHDRHDVFVVADNCTDATADVARRAGAIVHERQDATLRSKGHALRWLLRQVRAHASYDAYVFFDADSEVAPDFLERMDDRLTMGSRVIQGHYRVLNADASDATALRAAALASLHYLRPIARSALGLSCGLKGNGMCFSAETLDDRHGWSAVGLAEDVELHLDLVRRGIRVDFAPEAEVRADMPSTLAGARSQNFRWEAGRLAALRRQVFPLLRMGLANRNAMAIDAAAEQLVPPLSLVLGVGAICACVGAVTGSGLVTGLALFGSGGTLLHVIAGLAATGAPARLYRALFGAPAYIAWKLVLYARAAVAPSVQPWVRTGRGPASDTRAIADP